MTRPSVYRLCLRGLRALYSNMGKEKREGTGGSVQRPRHGTAAATAPVDLPAHALYMQMCTQVRRYIFVWPNPDSPPWPRTVSHNTYWVRLCALGQKWAAAADSKQLTRKICTAFSAETIAITRIQRTQRGLLLAWTAKRSYSHRWRPPSHPVTQVAYTSPQYLWAPIHLPP